jgi:hypothetical protein
MFRSYPLYLLVHALLNVKYWNLYEKLFPRQHKSLKDVDTTIN